MEQRVGEDCELPHDGGNCDLGRLTGGDEGLILGLHVRVKAGRNQGWHVEGLPEMGAAAPDVSVGAVLSRVASDRSEAGKACDALVVDRAELGHLDQHSQRSCLASSWDADKNVEAGLQLDISPAKGPQGGINGGDLSFDLAQPLIGQALEQGCTMDMVPVGCCNAVVSAQPG